MSDRRRDPVDEAIVSVGGFIAGTLISVAWGYTLAKQHEQYFKQWFENAKLVWPHSFELDFQAQNQQVNSSTPSNSKAGIYWLLGIGTIFLIIGMLHPYGGQGFLLLVGTGLLGFGLLKSASVSEATPIPEASSTPRVNVDDAIVYQILLPKSKEWKPVMAQAFMAQILQKNPRLTFQIVAEDGKITWRMVDWRRGLDVRVVEHTVRSFYPEAEVIASALAEQSYSEPLWRAIVPICQGEAFVFPRRSVADLKGHDPLMSLTEEMSNLAPGERIVYTLHVANPATFAYQKAVDLISVPEPSNPGRWLSPNTQMEAAYTMVAGKQRIAMFPPSEQSILEARLTRPWYHAVIWMQIDAPTEARLRDLLPVSTQINQFRHEDFPDVLFVGEARTFPVDTPVLQQRTSSYGQLVEWMQEKSFEWKQCSHILEPAELAAMWHLPHRDFSAPAIGWVKNRRVRIPEELARNQDGICLGDNVFAGKSRPVYFPYANRTTHMAVFGATGAGKTTFLYNQILQDIANGKCVCVIDPLGKLVKALLWTGIPPEREADVVLLDVGDEAYPPPFNIMSLPAETGIESASGRVMSILAKLFPEMPGTRWADTLAMALLTLKAETPATLRDVNRVLSDAGYRDELLSRSNNEALYSYWEEDFDRETDPMQRELTRPIKRHIRDFIGNPFFYPISCHPQGLDFTTLLQEGKIILVSLGADENQLTAREKSLLGALLISQIQMAATSGACQENGCYLYVDEAQEFITTSLPKMLTQARQFNLSLVLANQFMGQLSGDTLEAIRGDVGAFVFFQLGDEDAHIAARYTRPNFEAEDIMNLDLFQTATRMRLGASTLPAFSLSTRLATPPKDMDICRETEARIREQSRKTYTPMSREDVLAWLRARYPRKPGNNSGDGQDDFSDPL